MNISYAGPKAIITQHGIDFDNNKDDKFVYLNIILQLIQAFDHEYLPQNTYSYNISAKRLNGSELDEILKIYIKDEEKFIENAKEKAEADYAHDINLVKNFSSISQIDRDTWIKNLELMRKYNIKREINTLVFNELIYTLGELIKKHRIKEITTPMFSNFMNVLYFLRDNLINSKPIIMSKINIVGAGEALLIKMDISI